MSCVSEGLEGLCLVLQTSLLCRTWHKRWQQLEGEERQYSGWYTRDPALGAGTTWFSGMPMPICWASKTHRWNSCFTLGTFRYPCNWNMLCTIKDFCAFLFLRSFRFGLWYFAADGTWSSFGVYALYDWNKLSFLSSARTRRQHSMKIIITFLRRKPFTLDMWFTKNRQEKQRPLETVVILISVSSLCNYTEFRGVTFLKFLRDVLTIWFASPWCRFVSLCITKVPKISVLIFKYFTVCSRKFCFVESLI